jgi:hypothetical protein
MGIADTLMVSNVGSAAVSGVSLVDAINKLVIYSVYRATRAARSVCAQYREDCQAEFDRPRGTARCCRAPPRLARLLSLCLSHLSKRPSACRFVGSVEPDVMAAAQIYFLITAFSIPSSRCSTRAPRSTGRRESRLSDGRVRVHNCSYRRERGADVRLPSRRHRRGDRDQRATVLSALVDAHN